MDGIYQQLKCAGHKTRHLNDSVEVDEFLEKIKQLPQLRKQLFIAMNFSKDCHFYNTQ